MPHMARISARSYIPRSEIGTRAERVRSSRSIKSLMRSVVIAEPDGRLLGGAKPYDRNSMRALGTSDSGMSAGERNLSRGHNMGVCE